MPHSRSCPRPIIVSVIFHFNIQMLKRSTGFPSIEKQKLKQRGDFASVKLTIFTCTSEIHSLGLRCYSMRRCVRLHPLLPKSANVLSDFSRRVLRFGLSSLQNMLTACYCHFTRFSNVLTKSSISWVFTLAIKDSTAVSTFCPLNNTW